MEDGALQKFRRSEMGKKLKTKDIFGYTIGSIGDCASYNFVLSFFSFFMTTVAGVSPAVAGTIISVAIVWDAITDPIIGYVIDHSKNKHGKRRPWILRSLIPLGASIVLMFLNVDLPQTSKNIGVCRNFLCKFCTYIYCGENVGCRSKSGKILVYSGNSGGGNCCFNDFPDVEIYGRKRI